jgi:hypothetical protein
MAAVQNILIYDVVAEPFYGVSLGAERERDIHLRRVADILGRANAINPIGLSNARKPQDRVAARCNHFAVLLISALRQRGVPARARPGFADYFNSGRYEDHWVVEYLDSGTGEWRYADPQFDAVWCRMLGIRHRVADVPKDRFLTAAEVWRACRKGLINPSTVGISHVNMYGLFMAAGSLVRDVAALNRVEVLPWDVWGMQPQPSSDLAQEQLAYFDDLAELLMAPDAHLDALHERYRVDAGLKVGGTVFNALLGEPQAIVREDGPTQFGLIDQAGKALRRGPVSRPTSRRSWQSDGKSVG